MQTQATQRTYGNHSNGKAQATSRPAATDQKPSGTTFDLVRKVGEADGKTQWEKHGSLFIRANGSGGVVYLKLNGQELEIAVFPRRARK